MALNTTSTSTPATKLKPAEGWLNVYISHGGKDYKVGAIPLDNSKPLHARINAACGAAGGVEPIEAHISMSWQAGGSAEPADLNLPF
jgi:hypothetical protein